MHPATVSALIAITALGLMSCGESDDGYGPDGSYDCATEERADVFQVDLTRAGERGAMSFRLLSAAPAPPSRGDNTWSLEIRDGAGAPVSGAAVEVTPFMPDHRHGTGIRAQLSDQGGGHYQAQPVNLWMPGLWEVTIKATPSGAPDDRATFRFCVAS